MPQNEAKEKNCNHCKHLIVCMYWEEASHHADGVAESITKVPGQKMEEEHGTVNDKYLDFASTTMAGYCHEYETETS